MGIFKLGRALLILAAVGICMSAWPAAGAEGVTVDREYFAKVFNEIVRADCPWPKDDIRISGFSVRPAAMQVPDGELGYRLLNQVHAAYLGRKVLSVAVLVDGREQGRVRMSGTLEMLGPVVCVKKDIGRNTILAGDDLQLIRRDISSLGDDVVHDPRQVVGKRLKTSLKTGAVLYDHLVDRPPLVKRGDLVTIIAQSENVKVSLPGKICRAGARGDLVRVKNMTSRREIYARVLDSGQVQVAF